MATTQTVIHRLTQLRKELFPTGKGNIFLYGSRARDEANPESDWDLLVITDDSLKATDPFLSFAFPFAELGWELGEQITPVHYTRSQWQKASNTLFFHNVSSEAIPL